MIRNLAQQIEAIRSGTNTGAASSGHNGVSEHAQSENNAPIAICMEVEDLEQKVTRLIEQVDQNNRGIGNLSSAVPWIELIEDQIEQEFHAFKVADRRRIEEIREVFTAVDERVSTLHRSREDTCELISDRVSSEMDGPTGHPPR